MNISKIYLLVIAFCSGMSVMAMEITASRLLAPYFGNSIFVWTNIIGIVMIALSIGYFYGGKLADKKASLDILLSMILAAGVLFLLVPWIIKPIANFNIEFLLIYQSSVLIFFASLATTALIFAVPIAVLGAVSPYIIKLYSMQIDQSKLGQAAGSIFAISTVGSIIGTFLPTLYLVPTIGTRATINLFAVLLVVLALVGLKNEKLNYVAYIVLPLFIFLSANVNVRAEEGVIFEDESAYQYIQVKDEGDKRYLIYNEGGAYQSIIDRNNMLVDQYYDYFNLLPYLREKNNKKKVLIIGLAGGTIASQFNYYFPGQMEVDGIEIDEEVIDIAKKYFNLDSANTNIINQDGRMYLNNSMKKYDIMIIDAYQRAMYIPWSLATKEFWELTQKNLQENGIVALNINSQNNDSELLRTVTNTISSVFEFTYITKTKSNSWNYMILATDAPLDFNDLSQYDVREELKPLARGISNKVVRVKYQNKIPILTDDWCPIEFITDSMIYDYLKNNK